MQLFLKQGSAASVLPLPRPPSSDDGQSERSSSGKSASGSDSDVSESDEDGGDGGDGGDEDLGAGSDVSSSSSSSSAISSALSFSSTTTSAAEDESADDDWRLPRGAFDDGDSEDPEFRLLERHRRSSRSNFPTQRQQLPQRQEISMQAIRNAETVGFVALLIPLTGIATMVATETLACTHHFDCASNYPTLSYAATFKPEGHAFMVGMCLTALFILVSSCLYYWFLRLRLKLGGSTGGVVADAQARYTALVCLVAGIATAVTLAGLAILDMRNYHDAHIAFTVLFFISSWVLIVFCHLARRLVLLRERERDALSASASRWSTPGFWLALKRWRRLSVPMAFTLGRFFILAGITSTALFGLLFLCVNGSWSNPLGFTAVQEAFFEAFAIVCQLLFMGTLSCELSLLSREVEARDYQELERRE